MRLSIFLNKKVYIILVNGWAYTGVVIDADDDSLVLVDKKGENVFLNHRNIMSIREVIL